MAYKGYICAIFREYDKRKSHLVIWRTIWTFRAVFITSLLLFCLVVYFSLSFSRKIKNSIKLLISSRDKSVSSLWHLQEFLGIKWENVWFLKAFIHCGFVSSSDKLFWFVGNLHLQQEWWKIMSKMPLHSAANNGNHCDYGKCYYIGFLINIGKYWRLEWAGHQLFSEKIIRYT